MKEYRLNVRFRLEDDAQRRAAEFLEHLDRSEFRSRNAFAVTLGDIRQIFREEVSTLQLSAPEPTEPKTLDVELTQAQKETNARNVLAALEAF